MIVFPNAKINIGLNITGKRDDGYHNLETIFYPVKICDALESIPAAKVSFTSSGLAVPGSPEDNLCLRAFRLLEKDYSIPPVHIHLHKNIPMGAGLGGGSSDASFLIRMFNDQFSLGMDFAQMERYAAELGADCPFFIQNKPVFADERGDHFRAIDLDLSAYFIVVVMPEAHVSTRDAFGGIGIHQPERSLIDLVAEPVEKWRTAVVNDFEQTVFRAWPVIDELKTSLYQAGAVYASMSGSGAAVYGIFKEQVMLDLPEHYRIFYGV